MTITFQPSVRESCAELLSAIAQHGDGTDTQSGVKDIPGLRDDIEKILTPLLRRPDLLTLGLERKGTYASWSSYLYFDCELWITLSQLPKGRHVLVHDHGTWEAVAVYRGAVQHTHYRRGAIGGPGLTQLEVISDVTLGVGDIALVAPPDDIHGVLVLEDSFTLNVHANKFREDRSIFDPEKGTYVIRTQAPF